MCALPEVDTCCCYCSLRTGSKVVGFVSLCRCVLVFIFLTLEMSATARRSPEKYEDVSAIAAVEILITLIHGTSSVLMLLATYQESRRFLSPWIVTTLAVMVLNVILPSALRPLILAFHHEHEVAVISVVTVVVDLYSILVVYSYYRSLSVLRPSCQPEH